MVGANMAFSRSVLEKVPAFDEEVGPGALGLGEETLFSRQLLAAGYRLVTAFDAIVEHHFAAGRISLEPLMEKAKRLGLFDAYLAHHWEHAVWPRPRWHACTAVLKQAWQQLLWSMNRSRSQTMPLGLLSATRHLHATLHYLKERNRPHNYHRHGLVKRAQADMRAQTPSA